MKVAAVQHDIAWEDPAEGFTAVARVVATGRRSYVLIGLILFVAGSLVAYQLFGHVARRVDVWIDPWADPSGAGFQIIRALYAFGRGGLFGEGLGQGLPTSIPYVSTDFIFAAVAAPAWFARDKTGFDSPPLPEPLLGFLTRHIETPDFSCRFRWRKDSIAMWDNRCTQHRVVADALSEYRRMERVTLIGDEPR